MKYVLIKPNKEADILFFKGLSPGSDMPVNTEFLAKAHVFVHQPDAMQYALDHMWQLACYSAVPMDDVDIFKAKLAGK